MSSVEPFFRELDALWPLPLGEPLVLRLLGSTALLLQTSYERGTKDGDVLLTELITTDLASSLLAIAGRGSGMDRRHRMYLDFVSEALPFLPSEPRWRPVDRLGSELRHFRLEALDVIDVVIAKLARFHKTDRDDIAAMAERDLIDAPLFAQRFQSAVRRWWCDARADDLPRIVENFHTVQTDELFVWPTQVALPPWVGDDPP
jgi:hypothetical protein